MGGSLPALDMAKAVFDLGYSGWVSTEVFHTDIWDAMPCNKRLTGSGAHL